MDAISIIIPTRNRQNYLLKCLESIFIQKCDLLKFEVIVVDNGSSDNTRSVVENYSIRFSNLHYYYCDVPGLHIGRHLGLKKSNFEWLAFLDDDVVLDKGWFSALFSTNLSDSSIKLVASRVLPSFENIPPSWIYKKWLKSKDIFELSIIDLGDYLVNVWVLSDCRKKILN